MSDEEHASEVTVQSGSAWCHDTVLGNIRDHIEWLNRVHPGPPGTHWEPSTSIHANLYYDRRGGA
jgi:hypothetical protein